MTVKELKELISDAPDEMEVALFQYECGYEPFDKNQVGIATLRGKRLFWLVEEGSLESASKEYP